MIVYLGIGFSWLLSVVKFRFIVILGVVLIAGNFVCEMLMGFMNTTDLSDAIYEIIGVAIAFVYLFITSKYGLILVNSEGL